MLIQTKIYKIKCNICKCVSYKVVNMYNNNNNNNMDIKEVFGNNLS